MGPSSVNTNQRRGSRTKAVLPVRVKGKDSSGKPFEELVHTLDVTASGVRLGSVRRELNVLDEITIFYRQRKMQYRVVWTKKLQGTSEFQVGCGRSRRIRKPGEWVSPNLTASRLRRKFPMHRAFYNG